MPFDPRVSLSRQWQRVRVAREDLLRVREQTERLAALHDGLAASVQRIEQRMAELQLSAEGESRARAADHERTMLAMRALRADEARTWERLWALREDPEYRVAFTEPDPLVSILIPTYDQWESLRDRALPSVLAQSYSNWECVVVGDDAPAQTAEVVASVGDPRLRFVNLPYRGPYPADRGDAWFVSGTTPWNTALRLARGRWIGCVADDDALLPHYVETLLERAREADAELAYGRIRMRSPDGPDEILGVTPPPEMGTWGIQCSLFHAGLAFIPLLNSDWMFGVPNDWSWAERLLRVGVRFAMRDEVVVDYFPSRTWQQPAAGGAEPLSSGD